MYIHIFKLFQMLKLQNRYFVNVLKLLHYVNNFTVCLKYTNILETNEKILSNNSYFPKILQF